MERQLTRGPHATEPAAAAAAGRRRATDLPPGTYGELRDATGS